MLSWLLIFADVNSTELYRRYGRALNGQPFTSDIINPVLCDDIRRIYSYTGRRRV
jgi:hypothetical protein